MPLYLGGRSKKTLPRRWAWVEWREGALAEEKISFTSQVRKVNVGNEFIAAMEVLRVESGVN